MKSAIALAYDYSTPFEIGRIRKEGALRSVEALLERARLVVLPLGRGGGLGKFASLLLEGIWRDSWGGIFQGREARW